MTIKSRISSILIFLISLISISGIVFTNFSYSQNEISKKPESGVSQTANEAAGSKVIGKQEESAKKPKAVLAQPADKTIDPKVVTKPETAAPPSVSTAPAPSSDRSSAPEVNVDPVWKEARLLAVSGELLKAREQYRSFLTQEGIGKSTKRIAQGELEALNLKILLSPIETEDSFIYAVQKGDSLYNIAKKNHTTVLLIEKSNHLKSDVIRPGLKLKITKAKFSIEVDKSRNLLRLFADNMLFKTYSVATGTNNSTPVGQFTIENKLENPTWYKAGAVVPPDSPENILGTRWLGFSLQGYGIHGTTQPETIGYQASSGCIRMLNQEVEELYTIVPAGTQVMVKD